MLNQNPYAVTTAHPSRENARVALPPRTGRAKWCFFLACVAIPLLVLGTGLAVFDIESIVGSGPVMLIYGGVLLFLTGQRGLPRFRWFAWLGIGFPIAIFMLIFLMSWSPEQAKEPVSWTIAVMTLFASVGLIHSLMRHRSEGIENNIIEAIREQAESAAADTTSGSPSHPELYPEHDNPFVTSDQRW